MKSEIDSATARCVDENLWLRHGRHYARLKRGGKDIWKALKTSDHNIAKARLDSFRHSVVASARISHHVVKNPHRVPIASGLTPKKFGL